MILLLAEGYTDGMQAQFLEDARARLAGMLQYEPYSRFAAHINVYAVPMASNEAGVSDKYGDSVDTYFGVTAVGKTLKIKDQLYLDRITALRAWVETHVLDAGAEVNTMHFLLNTTASVGSSSGVMYSFSALGAGTADGSVMAHELAHSLGALGDEYSYNTNAVNLSDTADPNTIKWKDLLGFRSIRIAPGNAEGRWIPTAGQCGMYELGQPFCEVCRLQLARRFGERMAGGPDLYVAQPEVAIEHANTIDSARYRITQANLVQRAQYQTLELRTVVQNFTDTPRTIRLTLAIVAEDGRVKERAEADFALPALTDSYHMAEACIYPSVKRELWEELVFGDVLVGEVKEVLADGSTRLLDTYRGPTYTTYTVQYQAADGSALPDCLAAQIPLAAGEDPLLLAPQTLRGRRLLGAQSSGQTVTFTYAAPVTPKPGTDPDGDGKTTVADALLALRALLDGKAADADADGDGVLSLADVLHILRLAAGTV